MLCIILYLMKSLTIFLLVLLFRKFENSERSTRYAYKLRKLTMLIKDYKNFYMNDTESIHDMLTRFKDIVNKTRGLGKKFDKEELIPKVLRLLTSMWESTITAII